MPDDDLRRRSLRLKIELEELVARKRSALREMEAVLRRARDVVRHPDADADAPTAADGTRRTGGSADR